MSNKCIIDAKQLTVMLYGVYTECDVMKQMKETNYLQKSSKELMIFYML